MLGSVRLTLTTMQPCDDPQEARIDRADNSPVLHIGMTDGTTVGARVAGAAHDSGDGNGRGRRFKHCPFSAL